MHSTVAILADYATNRHHSHVDTIASPLGEGYWTPAVWPGDGNNHTGLEADTGCPPGGCLFNLRLDRTEHLEFSATRPALKAKMAARLKELVATRFQTNSTDLNGRPDADYNVCGSEGAFVSANQGFVGPCCSKGK